MLSYCPITSNFPLRIRTFVELTVEFSQWFEQTTNYFCMIFQMKLSIKITNFRISKIYTHVAYIHAIQYIFLTIVINNIHMYIFKSVIYSNMRPSLAMKHSTCPMHYPNSCWICRYVCTH